MFVAPAVTEPQTPATSWRNALTILVIITLSVLPILIAWWMAVLRPQTILRARVNHGTLIKPPIVVAAAAASRSLLQIQLPPSEWALIYLGLGAFDVTCSRTVQRLAGIRLVSGLAGTRIHVVALIDAASPPISSATTIVDPGARAYLAHEISVRRQRSVDTAIVFLDWRGLIMMSFANDAPSAHIKADLQRLLRA